MRDSGCEPAVARESVGERGMLAQRRRASAIGQTKNPACAGFFVAICYALRSGSVFLASSWRPPSQAIDFDCINSILRPSRKGWMGCLRITPSCHRTDAVESSFFGAVRAFCYIQLSDALGEDLSFRSSSRLRLDLTRGYLALRAKTTGRQKSTNTSLPTVAEAEAKQE